MDKNMMRRNCAIHAARTLARFEKNKEHGLFWAEVWIKRARKHAPLSQIQEHGFYKLLGPEDAERVLGRNDGK